MDAPVYNTNQEHNGGKDAQTIHIVFVLIRLDIKRPLICIRKQIFKTGRKTKMLLEDCSFPLYFNSNANWQKQNYLQIYKPLMKNTAQQVM